MPVVVDIISVITYI